MKFHESIVFCRILTCSLHQSRLKINYIHSCVPNILLRAFLMSNNRFRFGNTTERRQETMHFFLKREKKQPRSITEEDEKTTKRLIVCRLPTYFFFIYINSLNEKRRRENYWFKQVYGLIWMTRSNTTKEERKRSKRILNWQNRAGAKRKKVI